MNYKELAAAQEEYIISMRRYFHEHPEILNHEDNTCLKILIYRLKKFQPHGGIGHTAVFTVLLLNQQG